jgi:hypothetical protein
MSSLQELAIATSTKEQELKKLDAEINIVQKELLNLLSELERKMFEANQKEIKTDTRTYTITEARRHLFT